MKSLNNIHPDLREAELLVYETSGLVFSNIIKEKESSDYVAFEFDLGSRRCKFRAGKITPKKPGYFVTIWKRIGKGPILPYDLTDPVDLFIFSVRSYEHFGIFVFPKTVLYKKGIVSKDRKGGKRAIRVYPPWTITTNKQSASAQAWQVTYFLKIPMNQPIESSEFHKLFH